MPDEKIGEIIQKKADDVPNGIKRGEKYVDEQGRELKNIAEVADEKQFVKEAFDESGKLKKNLSFSQGEFGYINETDELDRLSKAQTHDLQLSTQDRLPHKGKTPGKIDGDHAGHLFGDRFGGSPELDNLVSQASNVNLSKFKKN